MKRFFCGILLFFGVLVFCAASGIADEAKKGNEKADLSYAFGMFVANDLAEAGFEFNYDAFIRGFREVMEKEPTRYTLEEAMVVINTAFVKAQTEAKERNLILGTAFLAENSRKQNVTVSPSGLQYEVITEGTGEMPGPSDVVLVHYTGTTIDGTVFDTTLDNGSPVEIPLDRVIPGWAEGLQMMREGGRAMLYIPPDLAYGENAAGGIIGPNAVLVFDVELVEIARSFYDGEKTEGEWQSLIE